MSPTSAVRDVGFPTMNSPHPVLVTRARSEKDEMVTIALDLSACNSVQ